MGRQIARRSPAAIAQHPLWQEARARLEDRFSYIRQIEGPRLDHGIAQYGQPMHIAPRSLQLVWSVGLLAYLSDLRGTLDFWASLLRPNGLLMFVTLGPDSFRSLALALNDPDQVQHVPAYPDMHDIGDALIALRMADPVMDAEWFDFTYTTPQSALADIRLLGGNPLLGRPGSLRGRAWRDRLLQALESLRTEGLIRLRIELVFGHAWSMDPDLRNKQLESTEPQPIRWVERDHKTP